MPLVKILKSGKWAEPNKPHLPQVEVCEGDECNVSSDMAAIMIGAKKAIPVEAKEPEPKLTEEQEETEKKKETEKKDSPPVADKKAAEKKAPAKPAGK